MIVGIVIPNIIEKAPYLQYYTDILDSNRINYEIICWNRDGIYPATFKREKTQIFQRYSPITASYSYVRKIYDFWLFSRYAIRCLKKGSYNLIIVSNLVNSVFLSRYLKTFYTDRFVIDIRDYTPIYPYAKRIIKKLIPKSAFTTISSTGFKKWLPANYDYILGHNIRKDLVENALKDYQSIRKKKEEIDVLTIGQIRDFSSNSRLISTLGNIQHIKLIFAGEGHQKKKLEEYAKNKFTNVFFYGKYKKEDELSIVQSSDFLNILLPKTLNDRTLMSNRFYLSLICRIPMIVNEESIQAEYVEKFKLGFVVSSEDDIYEKLLEYRCIVNNEEYTKGCEELLRLILNDITIFERKLINRFYALS